MSKTEARPKTDGKQIVGKNRDQFRQSHVRDFIVPQKIRAALERLGREGWEYEGAFIKVADVSTTDLAAYRDQFEEYIVTVGGHNPKRCWCGSTEFAAELREMI